MSKLSTDPYKGVRDFYPKDMYIEKYMFKVMSTVCESFGYVEYTASPLELAELYKAKSGEEIINEQTYTFTDRGGREVTLRPEMTPTVARMVSQKRRELGFPLRWYSIPNLFRYENPQRGRLREHYQLNVDVFGIEDLSAEIEIISVASEILKRFGAKESDFLIRINSRELLKDFFALYKISNENKHILSKIIDKKDKIDASLYHDSVKEILGEKTDEFINTLGSNQKLLDRLGKDNVRVKKLIELITGLESANIKNVEFTPTLMRGFDYYTDIVFEIFDTNPENRRSLFGGGRYDGLTQMFDSESVPAVGFGMGDVTVRDFLETHNLLPKYKSEISLCIASVEQKENTEVALVANNLRRLGLNVATDTTDRKIADKIKATSKLGIPYFIAIGEEEVKKKEYKIKNLESGEEKTLKESDILAFIHNS